MPRLLGVEIPGNKKLAYSLRYIYGIGLTRALEIVQTTGLDPDKRARDLNEEELNKITEAITRAGYKIEGDLRREVTMSIKRLMDMGCYRGFRHRRGLPCRGQRTRTNARTRKGPRKAIAGKK